MPRRQQPDQHILDLIKDEAWPNVEAALKNYHPADIADIINNSPSDVHSRIFSLVSQELKPKVLSELIDDLGGDVVDTLTNAEVSRILEDMAPDDAADLLGDLSEERSENILELLGKSEPEDASDVRKLLEYGEETAGGIMTTDVVAMRQEQTVEEALQAIAYTDIDEQFFYVYIIDKTNKLIGYVNIWDLLRQRNKLKTLKEISKSDFAVVTIDMDQEKVAQIMSKYDLSAIPVVDVHGVLLGRVTSDDVIDVIEEEASEDILRLAGSDDEELDNISVFKSCIIRLPWLFITLLGSAIIALILNNYNEMIRISGILVLGAFVPGVFAMAGNTGIQSSTLLVRNIALGNVKTSKLPLRIMMHELLVGAAMGLICALAIGCVAFIIINSDASMAGAPALELAAVVSTAMFSAMTFAAFFGSLVPVVLNKLRIDPAIASGPFITIANDVSSLLIYFGVTIIMANKFFS